MINKLHKKYTIFFVICFLHIIIACNLIFSVPIDKNEVNYILSDGTYAIDTWAWIDMNRDSIAECYRLGTDGKPVENYEDEYGRKTNEKGQLIENGFVVEKMLSSGKVRYGEGMPFVDVKETISNKEKKYDLLPYETIEHKNEIRTVEINEDFIGPIAPSISGQIIYAGFSNVEEINGKTTNVNVKKSNNLVAGKKIDKFIIKKNLCKTDVDNVVIYGGNTIWDDCIELRGTNASIKFNIKSNNYMYFEVAEEPHVIDEKDINISLLMYVDDEL